MDPPEFQRQTLVLLDQYLKHNQPPAVLRAYDRAQSSLLHDAPEYPDTYLGERIQDFMALHAAPMKARSMNARQHFRVAKRSCMRCTRRRSSSTT